MYYYTTINYDLQMYGPELIKWKQINFQSLITSCHWDKKFNVLFNIKTTFQNLFF